MKSKIHVFSRMFTEKFAELAKVNMFLFVLFAVLMSQSAWAYDLSSNGEAVTLPCTDPKTVSVNKYNPVTSFVIYDDGGSGNNYSNNCGGYLTIDGLEGYGFKVSGWVMAETYDTLRILNGSSISWFPQLIADIRGTGVNSKNEFGPFYTTDNHMVVSLRTDGSVVGPGVMMNVELVPLRKAKGSGMVWFDNPYDWFGASEGESQTYSEGMTVPFVLNPNYKEDELWGLKVRRLDGGGLVEFKKKADTGLYEFVMPASDVYVDVKTESSKNGFDLFNGERSLFLGGTKTLKVYDNGGPDYPYSNNFDGWLSLSTPSGFHFNVTGTVETEPSTTGTLDYLEIYEGEKSALGKLICKVYTKSGSSTTKVDLPSNCVSSNEYMTIHFRSDVSITASGLDLTVSSVGNVYSVKVLNTDPNGRITSDVSSAETRSTVTVTAKPNSGYVLKSVSVVNKTTGSGVTTYGNATKDNKVTFTMPSSDVEVTPVFVKDTYSITKKSVTGGYVTGASSAKVGATVTMTVNTTSGYLYKGSSVSGSTISGENGFLTKTFTFTMPIGDVTVTPSFTNDWTVEGGLYVNMPTTGKITATLPAGVQSFKIYDDGGKNGYYSRNSSGTLVLTAPSGYYLQLSGSVNLYSLYTIQDYLTVCDGTDTTKTKLVDKLSGSSKDLGFVYSSGQSLTLYFNSDEYGGNSSGLDLTVNVMSYEKQITYTNTNDGGSVVSSSPTKANYGSTVSYTYDYTSGYLVSDIKVVGENNYVVKASGGWYNNKKASFKMPPTNATVTSTYTNDWSADGGLYIDMPKTGTVYATIPDGVKSFKVYDDGGKSGSYSMNSNGTLVLTAPTGYFFEMSGNISTAYTERSDKDYTYTCANDYLSVYNGTNTAAASLLSSKIGCTASSGSFLPVSVAAVSKGNTMTLNFKSGGARAEAASGLDLMVKLRKLTPEFVNNKYVNMITNHNVTLSIPAGVESFKVYDNGGMDDNYLKGFNDTLVLSAPSGYVLTLSGNISTGYESQAFFYPQDYTCNANDNLSVYDGASPSATALLLNKTSDCSSSNGPSLTSIGTVTSRSSNMTLVFKSNEKGSTSKGLDLTVTLHKLALDLADDGNGNKYVNMVPKRRVSLTIPTNVTTFNVYDNGGKGGNYCANSSDTLVLKAPTGYALLLSGSVYTESSYDTLFVYNGSYVDANNRLGTYKGYESISGKVLSRGENVTLWFKSDGTYHYSGFDLTVTLVKLKLEPKYDGTSYYVDMVYQHNVTFDIPDTLKSFNVYDEGGKNASYSGNNRDTLVLKAPAGYILQLSGSMSTESRGDSLFIYDGANVNDQSILGKYAGYVTSIGDNILSSGQSMTLRFKTDGSYNYTGLSLTGTLIPLNYAIQVKSAANGKVVATKTTGLHVKDMVSFVAVPNNGYMLKDIVAKDLSGDTVKVSQYSFSVSELIMPAKDLIITPTFTNTFTAAGGLHLDMRKNTSFDANIPSGVQSFKVYDNGGKNGVYEANSNDTLILAAPEGYRLKLTGSVNMEKYFEYLYVYDGNSTSAKSLLTTTGSANYTNRTSLKSIETVTSSDRYMTLHFRSDHSNQYDGLDLTVTLEKINYTITHNSVTGGTLNSKDADTLGAVVYLTGSPTGSYHLSNVTVVDKDENVIKSPIYAFDYSKFTLPASNVTVTPTWTNNLTAEGGLHLDLLKNGNINTNIPAGVKSFNLYDNGGKNGAYESNSKDILTLNAPTGFYLVVTGLVTLERGYDSLYIFDGANTSAAKLFGSTSTSSGSKTDIGTITSSGRSLTFRFKSNGSTQYSGLNLVVSVEPITYGISIANAANGRVSSDKTKAAKDSIVNLSWVYTTGYLIWDIDVKDASENKIAVNGGWYSGATASFVMPGSAVTVTPTFTNNLTAEGDDGLYINMPKTGTINAVIPAKVKSFKVYDDGGKNGVYSTNGKGTLSLTAPEGYLLELSGSVVTEPPYSSTKIYDYLNVYDGVGKTASVLIDAATGSVSVGPVRSTGNSMTLYFESDISTEKAGLDLTVALIKPFTGVTVADIASQTYTGSAICPDLVVTDGRMTLVKNTDYTVECANNINAGTATVTVAGAGAYAGEVEMLFTITPKPLTSQDVELVYEDNLPYTGSALCPEVVVKDGETVLEKSTDYTVACSDNVSVGTATVTISGIGNYTGVVSNQFAIIPKVVKDFAAVTIKQDEKGKFAVIDGNYSGTDAVVIENEVENVPVVYNRSFPANAYSTIMLPFDVNTANIEGPAAVLRYNGIKKENGTSSIRMKVVWATDKWVETNGIKDANGDYKQYPDEKLNANTPYLVQMGDATTFKVNGIVTIKKTTDSDVTLDDWTFRGTWQYKKWTANDDELGYAYGFAASASETNNIKVGDFVKVGVGAWIRPMRAYLVKAELPKKAAQLARANGAYVKRPTVVPEELPELMSIVIDGDDDNEEHTTVIGHFNTRTGEIKMNYDRGKFDLKGRRVNGTNNARGAYYGKKAK